jgi:hypothetical protein
MNRRAPLERRPSGPRSGAAKWGSCALWLSLFACAPAVIPAEEPAPAEKTAPSESSAPIAPSQPSDTRKTPDEAPAFVKWCASGGAPIVGAPVVDPEERSYVATSDGYVHAFERDGRFRWSYTVSGTPLGSVSLRPSDGAILIGTTAQFIYAINQNGSLRFRYQTLTPVWSGLHALNPETVVFLGHDERVYAISNEGLRKYRVHAPSAPMGEPVVAPRDVVWLPLVDGLARFEAAFKLNRFPLPAPVEKVVALGSGAVVRAGGQGFYVAADGTTRGLGPTRLLAGDGARALLVDFEGGLVLLGEKLEASKLSVPADVVKKLSAAPVFSGESLWFPLLDGRVVVTDFDYKGPIEVALKTKALGSPVVGVTGKWALVPARGGEFCAVEIRKEGPRAGVPPITESF